METEVLIRTDFDGWVEEWQPCDGGGEVDPKNEKLMDGWRRVMLEPECVEDADEAAATELLAGTQITQLTPAMAAISDGDGPWKRRLEKAGVDWRQLW